MIKIICTSIAIIAAFILLIAMWIAVGFIVTSPPAPVNLNDTVRVGQGNPVVKSDTMHAGPMDTCIYSLLHPGRLRVKNSSRIHVLGDTVIDNTDFVDIAQRDTNLQLLLKAVKRRN